VESSSIVPALEGLVVEAVEWLPSGSDAGLVRVRGRWTSEARREAGLPALGVRRGEELRTFESLPDARFGRDPLVWRGTYLVPAALMEPAPEALWLAWESGVRAGLPVPGSEAAEVAPVPVPQGGEVIDRAVLAERRARRAETAERLASERAAEALKAVEVLELRSAELERRLEEVASASAVAPEPLVEVVERGVPPEALESAMAQVRELRAALDEQRQKLRRSELLRAADEVELATLRAQAERTAELEAALAEAESAQAQAAEQLALGQRRAAADAAERDALQARLSEREAELAAVTEELGTLERRLGELESRHGLVVGELETERRGHGEARARAEAASGELATVRAALSVAESARRAETVARAALDAELDRERAARASAESAASAAHAALDTARADLAAVQAERAAAADRAASAESTASALQADLTATQADLTAAQSDLASTRVDLAAAQSDLASTRADLAAAQSDLAAASEHAASAESARAALEAERDAARAELATTRADLETARAHRITAAGRTASAESSAAALQEELDAARAELAAAHERVASAESSADERAGGLLARIAELERAGDDDLATRAAEQTAAAAAVPKAASGAVAADLDAAAAALRARTEPPAAEAPAPPVEDTAPAAESPPAVEPAAEPAPAVEPAASEPPPSEPAPTVARRNRPRIITEPGQPSRADLTGASKREYPWLRGAVVKLAHDDPRAAARLLIGLVPVQKALVPAPLDYDLTIREAGTFSISITEAGAAASEIEAPRPRSIAAFHATADALTLAELLAGVDKRMGRWLGPVKVQGRKRGAETVRDTLTSAQLDLTAAARQGADLDPDLVFRLFAYAIHPSWTKGHRFTVAQELLDPQPLRWHVHVRDGAPVAVERRRPPSPPDAVVSMTRAAFGHLLRDEPAPAGSRPSIKGDRAAVATLKAWTERAQGRS
jgi:hypothetical protein